MIFEGPVIRVVSTPNLLRAKAISYPCLPLDSFEIYLTGSIYSGRPAVTNAFNFFLLNFFCKNNFQDMRIFVLG